MIKKFRIVVIGPTNSGKTQIINRFINSAFTGYYEPTDKCTVYNRAFNLYDDDYDHDPHFFDLEIWDMFPHDHPWLNDEPEEMDKDGLEMLEFLENIMN